MEMEELAEGLLDLQCGTQGLGDSRGHAIYCIRLYTVSLGLGLCLRWLLGVC